MSRLDLPAAPFGLSFRRHHMPTCCSPTSTPLTSASSSTGLAAERSAVGRRAELRPVRGPVDDPGSGPARFNPSRRSTNFVALVLDLVNGLGLEQPAVHHAGRRAAAAGPCFVHEQAEALQEQDHQIDVALDVVHANDAALVADLERRSAGRLLRQQDQEQHRLHNRRHRRRRAGPGRPSTWPRPRRPAPGEDHARHLSTPTTQRYLVDLEHQAKRTACSPSGPRHRLRARHHRIVDIRYQSGCGWSRAASVSGMAERL